MGRSANFVGGRMPELELCKALTPNFSNFRPVNDISETSYMAGTKFGILSFNLR
jgi:hypothetical protein